MKPISFRPSSVDKALIEKLLETGQYKNATDLFRNALLNEARINLESAAYLQTVVHGYEKEVTGE